MRPLGLVVLASVLMCAAVWLVLSGSGQQSQSLERTARHLQRASTAHSTSPSARVSLADRLGAIALASPLADRSAAWAQPLRLVNRTVSTHVGLMLAGAFGGLVVPALFLALLNLFGIVSIGFFIPLGLSLLAAILVPLIIHSDALSRGGDVRIDMRHQLSAYLDMVTMLLAGNTGYEGALEQAAQAGDGRLFRELRRRMREEGTKGRSLVGALARVGDDFGIVELDQVAATATLAAAEGAPVARTLAAKCATLRSTLAADQEANARVRNDKVTPPLVGMALLFMALIIYPALNFS